MDQILTIVIPVFGLIGLGYAAAWTRILGQAASDALSEFVFVIAIGWLLRRRVRSSQDFLTSHQSVPLWITSLAFIAANLGAQEVMGMCASGAKYGAMTFHFYWAGAIPAMIFYRYYRTRVDAFLVELETQAIHFLDATLPRH